MTAGRIGDTAPALPSNLRSWIEVIDEGRDADRPAMGSGKRVTVHLVVDTDGVLTRFKIPNVITVDYHAEPTKYPVLTLGIGNAHIRAHVSISPGKSTIEDLMTEIAAARITEVDP